MGGNPSIISRRRFLVGSAALLAGGTFAYTWRVEPHWIDIEERTLPIALLPKQMVGRRIVQLSDIHVGGVVDKRYLRNALERVADLNPDVIVVTGDMMTYENDDSIKEAANVLKSLPHAPFGNVFVLGNHDYGYQFRSDKVACEMTSRLRNDGHVVLRNEALNVNGLTIVGLDDLWGPRFDPLPVMQRLNASAANLVLCHNPDTADRDVWADYRGWILCGHTHGGQCKPPFLRPPILPVQNKRYSQGFIELGDGRLMYINRGLGYLRRVRFNARPEITVFTLDVDASGPGSAVS